MRTSLITPTVLVPKEVDSAAVLIAVPGAFYTLLGVLGTLAYLVAYLSGIEASRWRGLPFALIGVFGLAQLATAVGLRRLRPWSRWACWLTNSMSFAAIAMQIFRIDDWLFRAFALTLALLFHFYGCVCLLQRTSREAFRESAGGGNAIHYEVETEDLG